MKNKRILIIGGTGALGKTLIRRYQALNDILVVSRDEHKHVALEKEEWLDSCKVKFRIGDVKDINSLRDSIEDYKPDAIINTAALKHVPICEDNPYESVNVNIIGHQNLIQSVNALNGGKYVWIDCPSQFLYFTIAVTSFLVFVIV
jgi:FlaA1/EpsC-like NDP-sugar epimerase